MIISCKAQIMVTAANRHYGASRSLHKTSHIHTLTNVHPFQFRQQECFQNKGSLEEQGWTSHLTPVQNCMEILLNNKNNFNSPAMKTIVVIMWTEKT